MDEQNNPQKEQDAILITFDHYNRVMFLNLKERGVILTALFEHYADGEINPDGDCKDMSRETWLVLDAIIGQVDRYLAIKKIKSKAGKLGGAPKGNQNASKQAKTSKNKQKQPEPDDDDTDNPFI